MTPVWYLARYRSSFVTFYDNRVLLTPFVSPCLIDHYREVILVETSFKKTVCRDQKKWPLYRGGLLVEVRQRITCTRQFQIL